MKTERLDWRISPRSGRWPAIAVLSALPFVPGAAPPAGAGEMTHALLCTAPPQVEPALRDRLCDGFLHVLQAAYPGEAFAPGADGPGLELRIVSATKAGLSLQLVWTDAAGHQTAGPVEAVSSMDRPLSDSMQQSLFQRALAATPMP